MPNEPTIETVVDLSDLNIRVPPGRVVGLRRTHLRVAAVLGTATVGVALVVGLGIDFGGRRDRASGDLDPPRNDQRPLKLGDLPGSYDQWATLKDASDKPSRDADHPPSNETSGASVASNDDLRQRLDRLADIARRAGEENQRLRDELAKRSNESDKDRDRVRASPLFFKVDEQTQARSVDAHAGENGDPTRRDLQPGSDPSIPIEPAENAATRPPSDQERKRTFLDRRADATVNVSASPASPGAGRTLQPGTILPAALLTGINTDLPGQVVAVVTRPVFDTTTGRDVLVPQGARLIGTYDSEVANGQDRALVAWDRLLLPDGRSVDLGRMRGTDAAGYAGVADRVDYHADQLAAGVGLSGVLAYVGNLARGHSGSNDASARDVIGDAVAQEAGRIGAKIVDRQLSIQPTITIRPGQAVYVMVDKAIELEPYRE